jgi:hypothetical protein
MAVRVLILFFWIVMLCRLIGRYQHFALKMETVCFFQNLGVYL